LHRIDKPNILFTWGDNIGWSNISAYNLGVMGYQTPNIARIAKDGTLFTDWYAQLQQARTFTAFSVFMNR
jgi:arylsulfatase